VGVGEMNAGKITHTFLHLVWWSVCSNQHGTNRQLFRQQCRPI